MKQILVASFILLTGATLALAGGNDGGVLPGSNQITPAVAAAATPAAVAVSSTSPTRIDTAVNTALAAILGANYFRSEVQVQVLDAAKVNCGYTTEVTTQAAGGFQLKVDENPVSFKLGKAIGVYCQGIVSTATYVVGGLGFK
jgi:hypothetical protein